MIKDRQQKSYLWSSSTADIRMFGNHQVAMSNPLPSSGISGDADGSLTW